MNVQLPVLINVIAFVVGQMLVTRQHWAGFLIWAGSNYLVALSFLGADQPGTAGLFTMYCAANIYSMWRWSRNREGLEATGRTPDAGPVAGSSSALAPTVHLRG